MTSFPPLRNRVLYLIQYSDRAEFISRDRLSKHERAELKRRGIKFREKKYRLVQS